MHNDFFLYDAERLGSIASEPVIAKGLAYFNENRVLDLERRDTLLSAQVEGSDPEWPYTVKLFHGNNGDMEVQCDCPFDEEPVCKHAVAVLYSYAAQLGGDNDSLGSAVDEAIKERVRKGINEVRVKQLSGDLAFGTWQASSLVSTTHWQQAYQVQIRSLDRRMNYCSCPDLANNQLGTCKHIEAVLHQIKKQPGYRTIKDSGPPVSFVYLSWESATHPTLRLHRSADMAEDLAELLNPFFDEAGRFKGRLPEDCFRLADVVYGRSDIELGEDAVRYARRLAEDAAQEVRAQAISREIMQSGGVLPGIRARLYPYQVEGVAFLASRGRALLADDMGLGKTLQAITAAHWMAQHADIKRILVVCPASLKHQWAREIEKFTGHNAQTIQGGAGTRHVQYRADALFFVVNYELVLRDLSVINETLRLDLLILDEAQRIKNWQTKIASTIKLISSRHAFVLTGTPLENRLVDLYSLLQVIDSRVLGPLWRCMIDFHITDERGKVIGYRNLSELRRRIAPVMLRRDRSLVRDQLPDRSEVRLDIPMTRKQKELHDAALSAAGRLATIAKRRPLTPSEQNRLMAALQQARMACNAAGLVDKETEGSPKLDELARLLEDLCLQSNQKVVVFSQWELMTVMVEKVLRQLNIGSVRLHGGVPTHKRGDLMDRFREDEAVQVFISTDAGGVGLNLQSASVLINLDMPWNPAVLDQRIARVHRLGQKQKVQIFLMLAEDSYEEQVARLVQGKRELFDNVISPEASEDVVGVSKRMLETIIEDLSEQPRSGESAAEIDEVAADADRDVDSAVKEPAARESADSEEDAAIRECIVRLQECLGPRIERILGAGGGLLVVVDQLDEGSEETAAELSATVPVALIDPRTLAGLQRLGAASPVAESTVLFEAEQDETAKVSPFVRVAQEKLRAAEVLIEQKCMSGAVELLASAMLAAAAGRAQASLVPAAEEASVWIYAEALPKGILLPEQANALTRAIAVSKAPQVPDNLIFEILEDARRLVG
jgi:superfamily II DNA or RNA helicase